MKMIAFMTAALPAAVNRFKNPCRKRSKDLERSTCFVTKLKDFPRFTFLCAGGIIKSHEIANKIMNGNDVF